MVTIHLIYTHKLTNRILSLTEMQMPSSLFLPSYFSSGFCISIPSLLHKVLHNENQAQFCATNRVICWKNAIKI